MKITEVQINHLAFNLLPLLFSIPDSYRDEKSKQNPPAFHEPVHRRAGILGLFPNLSLPLLNGDDFSDLQRFPLELLQSLAPFSSFQPEIMKMASHLINRSVFNLMLFWYHSGYSYFYTK